jgi:cytochrome b6-f complex iron-sulfur subunit
MMTDHSGLSETASEPRRAFLETAGGAAMAFGLTAGYGMFGVMLGRFVHSAGASNRAWLFVCTVEQLAMGGSLEFLAPSGQKIVVARQGAGSTADDFLALSSVCPHLGCSVHWEGAQDRFFCPCHNGAFDRQGKATEGPPAAARQALVRFPLRVENGLLFLEAPLAAIAACPPEEPRGGGAAFCAPLSLPRVKGVA